MILIDIDMDVCGFALLMALLFEVYSSALGDGLWEITYAHAGLMKARAATSRRVEVKRECVMMKWMDGSLS